MYMPAQIQLKTVKVVESEPESDVPSTWVVENLRARYISWALSAADGAGSRHWPRKPPLNLNAANLPPPAGQILTALPESAMPKPESDWQTLPQL